MRGLSAVARLGDAPRLPLLSGRAYDRPMRSALALILFCSAGSAPAWEFSPQPVCTLTGSSNAGAVTITYDAAIPEYTIILTLTDGQWAEAPVFAMAFGGGRPLVIQTDRHSITPDGRSLMVKDSGFGNVLNGLEFNSTAIGAAGDVALAVPLSGIGPAIRAFRDCPSPTLS